MSRKSIQLSESEIKAVILTSESMKQASDKMGVTYSSFIRYAKKFGLYNPNQGLRGSLKPKTLNFNKRLVLKDILENKQACQTAKLKSLLYAAFIKKSQCEECGIVEWNGKKLVMHLDHVDGNRKNNELHNLRILCPNCHSMTPTYCRGHGKLPSLK